MIYQTIKKGGDGAEAGVKFSVNAKTQNVSINISLEKHSRPLMTFFIDTQYRCYTIIFYPQAH